MLCAVMAYWSKVEGTLFSQKKKKLATAVKWARG
jgi:hypothetical protein